MSIGSREQIRTEMVYEILRPPPQGSSPNKSSLLKFIEPSQTASPAGEPGFKHTSLRGTFHNQAAFFFPVSCHLSASSIEPNHTYQLFLLPHEFLDLTDPPPQEAGHHQRGFYFPKAQVCANGKQIKTIMFLWSHLGHQRDSPYVFSVCKERARNISF